MPIFRGKNFVSSVSDYKDSVRVAVRTNINLSGTVSVIDGVTLSDKDRVLVAGQASVVENGIYTWSSSDNKLTRSSDADSRYELSAGNKIYVEEGNTNEKTNWVLISTGIITPGISNIVFAKESRIGPVNLSGTYGSSTKTLEIALNETGQIETITEHVINGLPTQANNAGKYLKTNGSVASWETISTTGLSASDVRSYFSADTGITINNGAIAVDTSVIATKSYVDTSVNSKDNSDEITEGATNLYFTNLRARSAISVSGSLEYNTATGVINYSQPSPYLTWEIVSANATCLAGKGYFVDTSAGAIVLTLPANATLGNTIRFNDLAGTFSSYSLTILRNGHKIQGQTDDLIIDANQSSFGLVYSNATYGWKIMEL